MSRAEKLLLHLSTWGVTVTGLVYLVMKYVLVNDDPFSVLGHPWQPHVLALHLLIGPFVIFSLGLIAREHVLERFRAVSVRRGRGSGIWTILLATPMVFSGYLLQVSTSRGARLALAVVHVASGALYALVFLAHLARAAARGRAGAAPADDPPGGSRLVSGPARGIESIARSSSRGPRADPGGRP